MPTVKEKVQGFLDKEFPGSGLVVEDIGNQRCVLRKQVKSEDMRPGKTISGPTMMAVADAAIYVAYLGENGSTQTVTTQLSINFLHKPEGEKDILARARLVKMGKSLIVGEAEIYSEGQPEMVALATATYSIPKS